MPVLGPQVPPPVRRRADALLHAGLSRLPAAPAALNPPRPLADPPAGSGLAPVMGDFGYPGVGWTLNWMYRGPLHWNEQRRAAYGRVSWSGMFGRRILVVASADAAEQVLVDRRGHWSNREGWGWIIGPFFDGGLMLLDDPDHHRDRRIMAQAFTRRRIEAYLVRMGRLTAPALDGWGSGAVHAYPRLKALTLDVATDVFLDEPVDAASARAVNTAFVDCVRAGTGLVRGDVPLTRWHRGLAGRRLLEAHFRSRVPQHRAGDGDDLLSALCHAEAEDGARFTDEQVVDHIIFLMMAAHDTSTITTSAVLHLLAQHPTWQDRVREESLAAGADVLDLAGLGALGSLDLVVKEALRLIPPVPAMGRMAVADTELDGRFVPAGTAAMVAPLPVHHDPDIWDDPERFDPERFAEGRREDARHRYGYLPFGGGAHKCIGMHVGVAEVKTIVHQLVRRVVLRPPAGHVSRWDWTSLPKPLDDLPLVLAPLSRP
jgi:cytochrome P450